MAEAVQRHDGRGRSPGGLARAGRWGRAVVGMLMLGTGAHLQGESDAWVNAPQHPKIEIAALRSRKTKVEGGDWDDKTEWVSLEIRIRSLELNKDIGNLKAYYWIFGKSAVDRKVYKVIQIGDFSFHLTGSPGEREVTHNSEEVTLRWDNTFEKFGERYDGWLIVVENEAHEAVAVKSTNPAWEKNFEEAFSLQKNAYIDVNFRPQGKPTL